MDANEDPEQDAEFTPQQELDPNEYQPIQQEAQFDPQKSQQGFTSSTYQPAPFMNAQAPLKQPASYPAYAKPKQIPNLNKPTGYNDYVAYCCCKCATDVPALKAISCFLTCQMIIDALVFLGMSSAYITAPSSTNYTSTAIPWMLFLFVEIWGIFTVGSIVTQIIARCKFKQGGRYGITKISILFANGSNSCGAAYYILMAMIFTIMGIGIGTVENPLFKLARMFFAIIAVCFIPMIILFISQIKAGCKALKQVEELPGGPRHTQTGGTLVQVTRR